jgi:hypothetical protein
MRRFVCFTLLLAYIVQAVFSLSWVVLHDAATYLYLAWLGNPELLLQRMPAEQLLMRGIVGLFGHDDVVIRLIDLAYLSLICAVGAWALRQVGWWAAASGALLFGNLYLWLGPTVSFERDYLLVLPLVLALGLRERPAWAGVAIALAFLFKPTAGIAVVAFLAWYWWNERPATPWQAWALLGMGFVMVVAGCMIYLMKVGGLAQFVGKFGMLSYTGYTSLGAGYAIIENRWATLAQGIAGMLIVLAGWVYLSLLAMWELLRDDHAGMRRLGVLLLLLCIALGITPIIEMKFFVYHMLPLLCVLCLNVALLIEVLARRRWRAWIFPSLVVLACFAIIPRADDEYVVRSTGRVAAIGAYLDANLQPGETVQPISGTGGVIGGMLRAEAPLATTWLYDFPVWFEAAGPAREQFVSDVRDAQPRYIIVEADRPLPHGTGTITAFVALDSLIAQKYRRAESGEGWTIYERR